MLPRRITGSKNAGWSLWPAFCPSSSFRPSFRKPYHHQSSLQQSTPPAATEGRPRYIPAPTEGSGPLLWRRPDRELPSLGSSHIWLKTLPIFIAVIVASSLALFNYQESSSSTVNSILYALRNNETSRQILGDEVYFNSKIPWISGELNLLRGKIDISFWVKGSRGKGKVRFVSVRKRRNGFFETLEWSLQTEDGKVVQLLDKLDGQDPFQKKT